LRVFLDSGKQLTLHFLLLAAIAFSLTASKADTAGNESTLAKLWAASLQAETDKNYDDALDQVGAYQQQGGDKFLAAIRTAWLCYLKKDYAEANAFYARASQMQPSALTPLFGLLNVAQAQKDSAKVQTAADAILRLEPSNYKARMATAGACYANKDYRGALSSYLRVLVYYPEDTDALSGASWSSFYLADPERAFQGFSKILSVYPDYPYAQQGYSLTAGKKSGNGLQTGSLQPGTGLQPSSGL
jgi:tetratricopeptide (TPR) repeat protein